MCKIIFGLGEMITSDMKLGGKQPFAKYSYIVSGSWIFLYLCIKKGEMYATLRFIPLDLPKSSCCSTRIKVDFF